jgi:hypothetical protein
VNESGFLTNDATVDTAERQRLLGRVYAVLIDLARQKKAATGAEPGRATQSVKGRGSHGA